MSENPYAAPDTLSTSQAVMPPPLPPGVDADVVRRDHLAVESHIKALGWFYMMMSGLYIVGAADSWNENATDRVAPILGAHVVGGGIMIALGVSLRLFKRWTRIAIAVITAFAVINLSPIGILLNSLALWLVYNKKSSRIFSREYQQIIAATPDLKPKISIGTWIFFGLAVLTIIGWLLVMAVQSLKKMGAVG